MIHLLFVSLPACVGFNESEQQMALMLQKDLEGEHIWVLPSDLDRWRFTHVAEDVHASLHFE